VWYASARIRYLGIILTDDSAGGAWREATISARGSGGQRLFLLPRRDLVVAITAGNYNAPDQARPPTAVFRDVLLPAFDAALWRRRDGPAQEARHPPENLDFLCKPLITYC
jgi:hypothetical protein